MNVSAHKFVAVGPIVPGGFGHVTVTAPVPLAVTVALPSQKPKHETSFVATVAEGPVGSFNATCDETEQPNTSEIDTLKTPSVNPHTVCVDCPTGGFQVYVYGAVPPDGFAVMHPSAEEHVVGSVDVNVAEIRLAAPTVALSINSHPLLSVTVYV